eukprot:SAG31_NODE_13_length_37961_cov_21.751307_38_plen_224_part_00
MAAAYKERHRMLMLHINNGVFAFGLAVIVVIRPYYHGFFNRFCAFGYAFILICNFGAMHAVEIDDVMSYESKEWFLRRLTFAFVVYGCCELVWTCLYIGCERDGCLAEEAPRYNGIMNAYFCEEGTYSNQSKYFDKQSEMENDTKNWDIYWKPFGHMYILHVQLELERDKRKKYPNFKKWLKDVKNIDLDRLLLEENADPDAEEEENGSEWFRKELSDEDSIE